MEFVKLLRTPFLENTSGGCFWLKNIQPKFPITSICVIYRGEDWLVLSYWSANWWKIYCKYHQNKAWRKQYNNQRVEPLELIALTGFHPSKHFNVVSTLSFGWYVGIRCDVGKGQVNVETTLYVSTLRLTTSNNVKSTSCMSTLVWKTLGNVETTLPFSRSSFTTLANVERTLRKWPFP